MDNYERFLNNAFIYPVLDMLELRDGYTGRHVQHVEDYISILTTEMLKQGKWGMTARDGYAISQAALMHDIGKIAIPDAILLKPDRLTPEEFDTIKTHTTLGAEALKKSMVLFDSCGFSQAAYNIAKHHHERWDGSGYPDGLAGEEIPMEARITAIADVYEALRSKRPYKQAMDRQTARAVIIEGNGCSFDPELVEVFLVAEEQLNDYAQSYL